MVQPHANNVPQGHADFELPPPRRIGVRGGEEAFSSIQVTTHPILIKNFVQYPSYWATFSPEIYNFNLFFLLKNRTFFELNVLHLVETF
ncbi:MAG: hypothetical protein CMK46_01725 [Porticoccus sp.]|nr:hypothetical protein [Porticoccus sp.]